MPFAVTTVSGRGRNDWIGPAGCAMFTLPLRVSCDSQLGGRASFLQHLATLSVVHAVRSMPGFQVRLGLDQSEV